MLSALWNPRLTYVLALITSMVVQFNASASERGAIGAVAQGFPRIAGMNIGGPSRYDDSENQRNLSKHDLVVLGFYPGWERDGKRTRSMRGVVKNLKRLNPNILVGQYTMLQEAQDSHSPSARAKAEKLTKENWWLTDSNGKKVRWTASYGAWDINISHWVDADSEGQRYPGWLARYLYNSFFKNVPEFDIWYLDNALSKPASKVADWDRDGSNDRRDDSRISQAYRLGQVSFWQAVRALSPKVTLMANSDDLSSSEYRNKVEGAFLEAIMGARWSTESREGWEAAMARYHSTFEYTLSPHQVVFNVHGAATDFRLMRFGLASALLNDGFFCYSEEGGNYRSVLWFDEFDVELGKPIDPPQLSPVKKSVYVRRFENGMALVNAGTEQTDIDVGPGYSRFAGAQDSLTNTGQRVKTVRLGAKDGLVLISQGEPQVAK